MRARTLKILVPTAALAVAGAVGLWTAASAPAAELKGDPAAVTPSKTAPVPEPGVPRPGPSYQCVTCGWESPKAG